MSNEVVQKAQPPMLILDDERDIKAAISDHDVRLQTAELQQQRFVALVEQNGGAFDAILNGQDAIRKDVRTRIDKVERTVTRATAPMNTLVAYVLARELSASSNVTVAVTVITLILSLALPELSKAISTKITEIMLRLFKKSEVPIEIAADTESNGHVPPRRSEPDPKRLRDKSHH